MLLSGTVEGSERAAYIDVAVRILRKRVNTTVSTRPRIEGGVQRPIRIEPRHSPARGTFNVLEVSSDNNLSIRLNQNRPDRSGTAKIWIEGRIDCRIRIEPHQIIVLRPLEGAKEPAYQNFPVGLNGQRVYFWQIVRSSRQSSEGRV